MSIIVDDDTSGGYTIHVGTDERTLSDDQVKSIELEGRIEKLEKIIEHIRSGFE